MEDEKEEEEDEDRSLFFIMERWRHDSSTSFWLQSVSVSTVKRCRKKDVDKCTHLSPVMRFYASDRVGKKTFVHCKLLNFCFFILLERREEREKEERRV